MAAPTFTYTYSPYLVPGDGVRFMVGDTTESKMKVSDEEIAACLLLEGSNVLKAAARICEALAIRYASEEDVRTGIFASDKTSVSGKYALRAKELRQRAALSSSTTTAESVGGFICPSISVDEKDTEEDNTDNVVPMFRRDMFDTPGGLGSPFTADDDNE